METIAVFVSQIASTLPDWIAAALAVVTAASAITALTPSPVDNAWLGRVRRILEALALNVGHARPGQTKAAQSEEN
jgi:hypothetical protein